MEAKRKAESAKYFAKRKFQEEKFSQQESNDIKKFVFKLAKRMKCENQDIVGGKCVKIDEGCLTFDDSAKLKPRKSHYKRLLNVEFVWDSDCS